MKVIIIYPKISYEIFSEYYYIPRLFSLRSSKTQTSPLLMMPAALPTLAALTPPDIDIELVDENIEDVDFDVDVDIVGISSFSIMANRAYEIADKFRARGVYVVVGGIHASVAPDEVLEHADTVVIGEAEDLWPQFLEDYKNNSAKKKYVCEKKPDMLNPVVPRWDKLKHKHYLSHLIQTARGCPFDCDFCSVSKLFGKPRPKPIAHIVKEIEELKKHVKRPWPLWVSFADDNIIGNPKRAKELFRALIPLKIKWWSQASINLANDEELLELAQQSGCDSLLIGFESVSQKAQQEVNKGKLNKVDDFKRAVKKIQEYGISLYPSFIFGFDDDEKTIFDETYNFLQETGMEFPMLSIMTPWAGTRLHKRLEKEGRLFPIAWEDLHSYSVYYTPKKMTADELLQGHRRTIYKLYSMEAIFERIEIAYENGSLRNKEKNLFFRFLVSTLLFKELLVRDKELKQFVRKLLKIIWTKKNIKSEPLLFLIDRFVFARKLKKASLNQE